MPRREIFLGGVFSFVPGAEGALSKILDAGFLVAVFLLRIHGYKIPIPLRARLGPSLLSRVSNAARDFRRGTRKFAALPARLKRHRASYARNFHVVMPFVRLEREQDGMFGAQRMALVSRGEDKTDFAADLFWALAEARRGSRWALRCLRRFLRQREKPAALRGLGRPVRITVRAN